jgi:large subunit ribosomal protein L35
MPRIETHKATAKRFEVTGKEKLRRRKQGRGHLRRRKSKRSLQALNKDQPLAKADRKRTRRILGLRQ